jgi:hypothetical protein
MVNLARSFAGEAVITLVNLMRAAKSEHVRLSAAREILSRGYGRSSKAAVAAADVAVPARPAQASPQPQPQPPQPQQPPQPPELRPQPLAAAPPRCERDAAPPVLPVVAALKSGTAALNGGPYLFRS